MNQNLTKLTVELFAKDPPGQNIAGRAHPCKTYATILQSSLLVLKPGNFISVHQSVQSVR